MANPTESAPFFARVRPWQWFLAGSALCTAVGWAAFVFLGVRGPGQTTPDYSEWPLVNIWVRWDAGWYLGIAERGYAYVVGKQSEVAYFPLYPLAIRAVSALGPPPIFAGIVITWLSGLLAFTLLGRWAQKVSPQPVPMVAVLAAWPFAYYFYGAIYSDALFLALVAGAFLLLERRQLFAATALAALSTAARPVAVTVIAGLCLRELELSRREGRSPLRAFVPSLGVAGLIAYMAFLQIKFDDPIAFLHAQVGWGQLTDAAGFKPQLFAHAQTWSDFVLPFFHLALALLMIAMAWPLKKQLGWGYAAYVVLSLAVPIYSSRDFIGLGRYCLPAFPAVFMWASLLSRRRWALISWLSFSTAALALMMVRFAVGRYVS